MKKTLMVLSFALCATFGFAQKHVTVSGLEMSKAVSNQAAIENSRVGYNASIFTKDNEILNCTFSVQDTANHVFSTGSIGANTYVNGEIVPAHTNTKPYGLWTRIPDTSDATILGFRTLYPVSIGDDADGSYFRNLAKYGDSPYDGFMVMTMQDQISDWGGDGLAGNFDAYIAFADISTVGNAAVRVRLYQYYRKFNQDKCWIDYSVDKTTWNAVQINVKGVDVTVNNALRGSLTTTLPTSIANMPEVSLRLRWSCNSNAGGAYGYIWVVDDFCVLPNPDYSMQIKSNLYFEGFYQMMPQGFQVPVVWVSEFINNGNLPLTNNVGTVYTYASGDANATALVSKSLGSVPFSLEDTRSFVIDPLGYYDSLAGLRSWRGTDSWPSVHGVGYYDYDTLGFRTGTYAGLPTATTGTHHFFTDITNNLHPVHIGDSLTFDTLRYEVNYNANATHPYGVWARDHGAIIAGSYYTPGTIAGQNVWSQDPTNTAWSQEGYGVFVNYTTGDSSTIPADWRLLGMEIVASTEVGMNAINARLEPVIYYFLRDSTGDFNIYRINTGASQHVVTANEVLSDDDMIALEDEVFYMTNGNYPVVHIDFPNQPALSPYAAYWVGYTLAESAEFSVATSGNYCYMKSSNNQDSLVRFYNVPGMESYGHALTPDNDYNVMVKDPNACNDNGCGLLTWYRVNVFPMIRLIVGPGYYVPKTTVTLECDNEDYGYFGDANYTPLCGEEDSVAIGGSVSYYLFAQEGYVLDKITLDGVVVDTADYEILEDEGEYYWRITLEDVTTPKTLKCFFKEGHVGIDPVAAGVRMNLQPNPATSNVRVSLKGVSGNVNMTLIDMSGRVVNASTFNAENGCDINVSNLAKGAYFVRITNDKFSKVEKLIVR